MTVRTRRPEGGIRVRLSHLADTEEKQQTLVTLLFIGAIVAVVLIILSAIGIGWYNDNLKAVGKVGSTEISPQMVRDSVNLESWQIARDLGRVQAAQVALTLDPDAADAKINALDSKQQNLSSTAVSGLIDQVYQSQLATGEGITTTDADVDARLVKETSDPEQRHVFEIAIAPQAADKSAGPTAAERRAALDQANKALADLQAGKDFATVAATYGTDDKSKAGGDLGPVTQIGVADDQFGQALFDLDVNGTTAVILGSDGTYRVGRVTEITPGAANDLLKSQLLAKVSEAGVRQLLAYDVAAEALQAKITDQALAQTPEQVKLALIEVDGLATGDADTGDGEIDYSQIVFAPNDDESKAANLAPDDPAWAKAKSDADSAFAELKAITDVDQRIAKFKELATANTDDQTSQQGGSVGFVTRDIPPKAISDALWAATFNKGDLIGPILGDEGYYVLMFNERRGSVDQRIQAVKDALAQPNADFSAIAGQLSEGLEKDGGGEIGWVTRDSLSADVADKIFLLAVGQVSDPIELGQNTYWVKVEDKQNRPFDPDQIPTVRQTAFDDWFTPKREQAVTDGTIVDASATATDNPGLTTGGDQP